MPFAMMWLARRRSVVLWVALGVTLLSPDPAVARYVLPFPALLLAAAAASVRRVSPPLAVGVTILGVWQLVYAAPGLTGEGPPLGAYLSMSDDERAVAVGADGPPAAIAEARRRIVPGEAFAFDQDMDLCDLAWDTAQSYRVVFLRPSLSPADVGAALDEAHVRVLVTGDRSAAHEWLVSHPLQFESLSALPSCRHGTCSLYARR
jgi:hypothetical protein